jgi:hypothetical protein
VHQYNIFFTALLFALAQEHVLLGYLFFDDIHCSMMAADAFIFLSRQAGPDTTLLYTRQLCTLVRSTALV